MISFPFHDSIIRATLEHNHKSMQDITEDFDKIEKQINTPETYDDERLSLEENILKQKVRLFVNKFNLRGNSKAFCSQNNE